MTAATYMYSKTKRSQSPKMIFKEEMSFPVPPGFELLENEPAFIPTENKPCKLSLMDLCGPAADVEPLGCPPGLEDVLPPPGLEKGIESDDTDTTTGSDGRLSEAEDSGQSDSEKPEKQTLCLGSLVLAERSELKASAKMFTPLLSATAAATLAEETQRTSFRTKLRTKADLFVPPQAAPTQTNTIYPFLPSSAVKDMWQKWYMHNEMYGGTSEWNSEMDGVSSYDTSVGNYSESMDEWTCDLWQAD
jgi:hypothetical protein